jgi:hypothetical protein
MYSFTALLGAAYNDTASPPTLASMARRVLSVALLSAFSAWQRITRGAREVRACCSPAF